MIEPQETTIGDVVYRVTPLGFTDGRKAFVRLSNLLGPALGALGGAGVAARQGATEDEQWSVLGKAVGSLLASLKDEDLEYFQKLFAARTTLVIGDKEPRLAHVLEEHFTGKLQDYFTWLIFCLKITYGVFFSDALTKLKSEFRTKAPPTQKESNSLFRQDVSGPTGDSLPIADSK